MFPGFSDADFDAYAPSKWSSNVYTRNRLEVKQKLLLLGREVSGGLHGLDGSPLVCDASAEYPALWNQQRVDAQHLFFWRNPEARRDIDGFIERGRGLASLVQDPSPQRSHIFLAVTVRFEGVETALRLHAEARVDRMNLERRCDDFFARDKLRATLAGLGEGWSIGVTGHDPVVAARIDDETLRGLVAAFLGEGSRVLSVWRSYPRTEPLVRTPALAEAAREDLAALLPVYHLVAWSRDNDFVSMKETLQREKKTRVSRGFAKNDRVRIVRGVFAGKEGVVHECDAKGGLRLIVGTVTVKVGAEDVEPR